MLLSHIRLKNWRNFQAMDVPLRPVTYVLGPNVLLQSGKQGTTSRVVDAEERQALQAGLSVAEVILPKWITGVRWRSIR